MTEISSNLQKIISYFGGLDALGEHPTQIDTQNEYNLLGQYLNGTYQIEGTNIDSLNRKDRKELTVLFKELSRKLGKPDTEKKELNVVNRSNIDKYLKRYQD
jgi:hypothetical protein